ncbi:MAG TPA: GspMb/PilO family protein [Pyrinomonadaceae bacterium]|nr:GspMb/PilO family protein [Pyrinomonadaceae bacterium]
MRNDTAVRTSGGAGASMRAQFDRFRSTRQRSALGLSEVIALALAALLLLAAILSYLFLLVPQNSRKLALETEREELQRMLKATEVVIGERKDTQTRVSEILTSLNRFEIDHLGQSSSGTKTVYEELNRLILKNNLRISGGINYTQLKETAPGADAGQTRRNTGGETAARVVQSVFPGIGVSLTVEGTYANLRRFIRDIEADRQFVVVNTVELEGVTDTNSPNATAPVVSPEGVAAQPSGPSRGALVSLHLDMAAYFRRAGAATE